MLEIVIPSRVRGLGDLDVGRFAQCVLAGVRATYLDIQGDAAVAGGDDEGDLGR